MTANHLEHEIATFPRNPRWRFDTMPLLQPAFDILLRLVLRSRTCLMRLKGHRMMSATAIISQARIVALRKPHDTTPEQTNPSFGVASPTEV